MSAKNKQDGSFLRKVLFSSQVGSTIRRAVMAIAIVVIAALLINSFNIGRDSYRAVSKSLMSSVSDGMQASVKGQLDKVLTSAGVLGSAFVSVREDKSPVRADRDAFITMLRNGVSGFQNCLAVGMYWEWLAFDGKEKDLQELPDYKRLYGRFAMMFDITDSAVVKDAEFEFSEFIVQQP